MTVTFFDSKRASEMHPDVITYYNDLIAQAVMGTVKPSKHSTATLHVFEGVGNDEISIETRLAFLNSPLAKVELFPVFILAKKGFEETEVLEGLPHRMNEESVRLFRDWHLEGNTAVIEENQNWVLIRTEVLNIQLSDTELLILSESTLGNSIDPNTMTTSQFQLWGMQEYKALKSVYFPVLEDSL